MRFLMLPLLLLGVCSAQTASPAPATTSPTLRVMSYNVRYDEPQDPLTWDKRLPLLARQVLAQAPDVLGTQEALSYQVSDLLQKLSGYASLGVGRGPDNASLPYGPKKGEFNAIFYRQDRLQVLKSGTFWLSQMPEQAGSKSQLSSLPRISTWAQFQDRRSNKTFFVFNTHFPHEAGEQGRQARAFAAQVLLRQIAQRAAGAPVIITGDLNASADDAAEQKQVLSQFSAYTDAFEGPRTGPDFTFYGFDSRQTKGARLDYVWLSRSPAIRRLGYQVLNDKSGQYYLSDHLPVLVELALP